MISRVMLFIIAVMFTAPITNVQAQYYGDPIPVELNNQIRREKFDVILPQIMRERLGHSITINKII